MSTHEIFGAVAIFLLGYALHEVVEEILWRRWKRRMQQEEHDGIDVDLH